ncbi:transcription termination factor Rho [Candidatus Thioglobus autotrophicus]|jgi:transcription termination factor Rho|uniref:Transcription termination factor Rho n=1 Tax=Candidatus Thioglobus autotrophicus TaxID=1705394 RepID=A0A0M4NVA9_9GAMM|nr:transcription termination factor Rho [Candidatus Thioglobus autotrophicus]ALE51830.1 transcription termination factor Rho [Candidatus Thioglobus autotrophicus]WPE15852.1 transcription termination factor Rho [Candidatus Thioglobus autotrophicus]WPE17365.1 transcription termination factor Rho [Candidatus Thioglobus autotrophicus]
MKLSELKKSSPEELLELAQSLGAENISRAKKQTLIFIILKAKAANNEEVIGDGVLDILQDGYGFLRSSDDSYTSGADDIYISPNQIKRFNLSIGDLVAGKIRAPKKGEKYFALVQVSEVNGENPENVRNRVPFASLTPIHPDQRLSLEIGNGGTEDITARVIDLIAPFGKGQRGLLVAPPKAGKTMIMQNIASSISRNHPECELIVLLIDERPEEVTEMARTVRGEVIASTFDEPAKRHVQVAEMVIQKAKRRAEQGKDVIILLDSITRLARAYNTVAPSSGKVLTGGVDANALQRPKRFFGAARNIENGGSITIIATALIDTGSKMDEVIYQEFKGTGNMELHLEKRLSEKRIFPAININASGTRREELITDEKELQKLWILRKILHPMDTVEAAEFLIDRLKLTKTNDEFFASMAQKK